MPQTPEPIVKLTKYFPTPFDNVIATARTCYSNRGIVFDSQVNEDHVRIAESIYQAGHHTTYQHAYFQFTLENVSRQFIWSFLHSHPFYNSEQVSQRYVKIKKGNFLIPDLSPRAQAIYEQTLTMQTEAYLKLADMVLPDVEAAYFRRFPARARKREQYLREMKKKAQETARYVMPIATLAYLYHTISGITLMRYYRLCQQYDVPEEQKRVVYKMMRAVLDVEPKYQLVLEEPLPLENTAEYQFFASHPDLKNNSGISHRFIAEFDRDLNGYRSRLVDWKVNNESLLADAVREVFGLPRAAVSNEEAIDLVLNPNRNALLGETLNLTTHDKLSRTMIHPAYTFRRKISHTADSQDQRHRMTPASRPILSQQITAEPDYITPALVAQNPRIQQFYDEVMARSWAQISALKNEGVEAELANYLLPNAVSVRYTESADLLNLHHKHAMRLCYNAQEEIWQTALDEALQIREINPQIGKYLLPPCSQRYLAGRRPICPEGARYCGERVWTLAPDKYSRVI